MNKKTDKVPATRPPKLKSIAWYIVRPEELEPERILARRRVLGSVPLFLMTVTTGAPPAGDPLRRSQMLPAAAVLADRSGDSWIKGVLVCATRPRPSKLEVLLVAVYVAARRGLISAAESATAEAELLMMQDFQAVPGDPRVVTAYRLEPEPNYMNYMCDIVTNDLYWDCDCEDHYIHHKLRGNHCPRCGAYEHERPDAHENELHQYTAEKDCAVRICPPPNEIYGGPGLRLTRVLAAEAKLTPQERDAEAEVWIAAKVDAHFHDRAEYFRSAGLR